MKVSKEIQHVEPNSPQEEWRKIEGFGDSYEISNAGRIKNKRGKVIKSCPREQREPYVVLYDNAITYRVAVWKLMHKAFPEYYRKNIHALPPLGYPCRIAEGPEEWRDIPGIEEYYAVSNKARIYSKRQHRTMVPMRRGTSHNPIWSVCIYVNGKRKHGNIALLQQTAWPELFSEPPGYHLREQMNKLGWTEQYLARQLGFNLFLVQGLLKGEAFITDEVAERLGFVIPNTSKAYWLNREKHYRKKPVIV